MILTQSFRARQAKSLLDELNRESGRIYTLTMVEHWRVKRRKDVWLSQYDAMRLNDSLSGSTTLHAHSRDSAQEGFYKACKTIKALKKQGNEKAKYPHHKKNYRSTTWKKSGIKIKDGKLFLARSKGLEPVTVTIPQYLQGFQFDEVRLAYNKKSGNYDWNVVVDDRTQAQAASGTQAVAVDLGEIHPAAACSQTESVVFTARELRSSIQGNNKAISELASKQSKCKKGSRHWWKLQRSKNRRRAAFKLKQRDICHKVSRAVVDFAQEQKAGLIVIGDVRDIADEVNKGKVSNQKISQWPHGTIQKYIEYKSAMMGIQTRLQNEAYSSQTCPSCGNRKKPKGRVYRCGSCGWSGSRDGQVGAANILSMATYGELGRVLVPETKYRYPYLVMAEGKRRHEDTMQVAWGSKGLQEAAGF